MNTMRLGQLEAVMCFLHHEQEFNFDVGKICKRNDQNKWIGGKFDGRQPRKFQVLSGGK